MPIHGQQPALTLNEYFYEAILGIGASYVPPVHAVATAWIEAGGWDANILEVEVYDGAAWIAMNNPTMYENSCNIFQDAAQNTRITMGAGARQIALTGYIY